jgi:hypothetical protein
MAIGYEIPLGYERYSSIYGRGKEVIGWSLYDTLTYISGTTLSLDFFTNVRANKSLSNMETAGALPAPKSFLIRAPRFFVKQRPRSVAVAAATNPNTGALDNLVQLTNQGVARLIVGSKEYGFVPLWMLCSGGGVTGQMSQGGAATGLVDYATVGVPDARNVWSLTKPILVESQVNFKVELIWDAPLTLAGGNLDLTIALDGDMLRAIQ